MNFWNLIGLTSKKEVDQLAQNIETIKGQVQLLISIKAEEATLKQVPQMINQTIENTEIRLTEQAQQNLEANHYIQGQNVKLNGKIEQVKLELVDTITEGFESKMVKETKKINQQVKQVQQELDDINTLLKIIAMNGISKAIDENR